ncbi:glycerate kinase [Vogesella sp. LIG4]|uniref:glycerate kinase n=1 Tax=Vogesella sp. LIG4 TaxID=1192162 RepID=UPI00081FC3FE|nr:glycerate kinase [Vogesella sp. LIG4]SCK20819.1 glycerate kinase [Vogesella sp. LIG4]
MRCVLAPDSFKGSLAAPEVAAAVARGLRRALPAIELDHCPMADGGEGTLQALAIAGCGQLRETAVHDAEGGLRTVQWLQGDALAVLEVAQVVGLPDVGDSRLAERHSGGVGELLGRMLDAGCQRIAVALGGSSTNDGGAGLLAALGGRWLAEDGSLLPPLPASWPQAVYFDESGLDPRLATLQLEVWSDVSNPLCGTLGASAVFGPQKGLLPQDLSHFDAALQRLAAALLRQRPGLAPDTPGGGAAGGMGFALQWLGARQVSGAEAVAAANGLAARIGAADWVITGEGRSDSQTLHGKAPALVAQLAREQGVPVSLLSGAVEDDARLSAAFDGCFSLCPRPATLAEAMQQAAPWLEQAAEQMLRLRLAARRQAC